MSKPKSIKAHERPKSELGASWVVESDGDDEAEYVMDSPSVASGLGRVFADRHTAAASGLLSYTGQPGDLQLDGSPSTDGARRRPTRTSTGASVEPEFIMPSIHEDLQPRSSAQKKPFRQSSMFSKAAEHSSHTLDEKGKGDTPFSDKLVEALENIWFFLESALRWIFDVVGMALRNVKTPISYFVAAYILFGLVVLLQNMLTRSLYSALSPICRLPGSSLLNLEMCKSPISGTFTGQPAPPAEFDRLMTVQGKFEEILEESAGGASLPLDMKRGETSIRDLRQVVRYSNIHSKHELAHEFDGFIETARLASYDLQRFNSHVGRAVDNVLATARWTGRVLDGIAARDGSASIIGTFISGTLLAPFQPLKFTEDALLDQYVQHARIVEDEIHRLIAEAQALLLILTNLEDRLDVIHGIALRDGGHANRGRDDVLALLWTQLGGNRDKLGKFDAQLRLLQQVNQHRQSALAHVTGTIVRLQAMGAELEELRERVGAPALLREHADIPLRVHIENIQMGVERLEQGRERSKETESEVMRGKLEGDGQAGRMIAG